MSRRSPCRARCSRRSRSPPCPAIVSPRPSSRISDQVTPHLNTVIEPLEQPSARASRLGEQARIGRERAVGGLPLFCRQKSLGGAGKICTRGKRGTTAMRGPLAIFIEKIADLIHQPAPGRL